jgi:hypothetical protein
MAMHKGKFCDRFRANINKIDWFTDLAFIVGAALGYLSVIYHWSEWVTVVSIPFAIGIILVVAEAKDSMVHRCKKALEIMKLLELYTGCFSFTMAIGGMFGLITEQFSIIKLLCGILLLIILVSFLYCLVDFHHGKHE